MLFRSFVMSSIFISLIPMITFMNILKTSSLVGVIKANGDIPLCVLNRNEESKIIGNFIKEKGFKNVWFSKKHTDLINFIDINMCRRPCKHDSYNIVYEAVINDYIHCNFL